MGAELHLSPDRLDGIDHLGGGDDFLQLGDAAFDEGLAFARGVVFGVFRQIAVAAGLGDGANDRRPLHAFS